MADAFGPAGAGHGPRPQHLQQWQTAQWQDAGGGDPHVALLGVLLLALLAVAALACALVAGPPPWLARALPRARRRAVPPPAPPRLDGSALDRHPVARERFERVAAVVAELQAYAAARSGPLEALHEHRLAALRDGLAELAATLGPLPPDVAAAPGPAGAPAALERALRTLALLEREAWRLREDVYAGAVDRLHQQHRFAEGKYGRPASLLDLS
ncbi:hypothetical protein [Kineococcus sp. G2]|uniref:hypothetical protein n=1 Tax=Kineococcus sp. G2 TaxID=3127484 RepID=UPI00301D05A2